MKTQSQEKIIENIESTFLYSHYEIHLTALLVAAAGFYRMFSMPASLTTVLMMLFALAYLFITNWLDSRNLKQFCEASDECAADVRPSCEEAETTLNYMRDLRTNGKAFSFLLFAAMFGFAMLSPLAQFATSRRSRIFQNAKYALDVATQYIEQKRELLSAEEWAEYMACSTTVQTMDVCGVSKEFHVVYHRGGENDSPDSIQAMIYETQNNIQKYTYALMFDENFEPQGAVIYSGVAELSELRVQKWKEIQGKEETLYNVWISDAGMQGQYLVHSLEAEVAA